MAGLPIPFIQTVTAKVQRSQSSVSGNIFLEDTQVFHGPVSDMINFFLSQATQSKLLVSDDHIVQYRSTRKES